MTPEEQARQSIDALLDASGWCVQTKDNVNLAARPGVAVCELSFKTGEPDSRTGLRHWQWQHSCRHDEQLTFLLFLKMADGVGQPLSMGA